MHLRLRLVIVMKKKYFFATNKFLSRFTLINCISWFRCIWINPISCISNPITRHRSFSTPVLWIRIQLSFRIHIMFFFLLKREILSFDSLKKSIFLQLKEIFFKTNSETLEAQQTLQKMI